MDTGRGGGGGRVVDGCRGMGSGDSDGGGVNVHRRRRRPQAPTSSSPTGACGVGIWSTEQDL
jgi:hypothetical protein